MQKARIHQTKKIRPISKTKSNGRTISPSGELRRMRDGQYIVVDDENSRHHMITAAIRLDIQIVTRKRKDGSGFEVHRICQRPVVIQDYCNMNTEK